MSEWLRIGRLEEFPAGGARSVRVGARRMAIFRVGEEWFALEDVCPHMRARLSEGSVSGLEVTCGWHGWRFDLRSGRSLTKSWASVRTGAIRVEAGEVFLAPPAEDAPSADDTEGG